MGLIRLGCDIIASHCSIILLPNAHRNFGLGFHEMLHSNDLRLFKFCRVYCLVSGSHIEKFFQNYNEIREIFTHFRFDGGDSMIEFVRFPVYKFFSFINSIVFECRDSSSLNKHLHRLLNMHPK